MLQDLFANDRFSMSKANTFTNDRLNQIDKELTYSEFENKYKNLTESERLTKTDVIINTIRNSNLAPTQDYLQELQISSMYRYHDADSLNLFLHSLVGYYVRLTAAIFCILLWIGITIYSSVFLL